jgi:hypothetical protein
LDGLATTNAVAPSRAAGDTIINAKFGLRLTCKGDQLYAGFGQAVTSQHWYQQIARIEYRIQF